MQGVFQTEKKSEPTTVYGVVENHLGFGDFISILRIFNGI